MIGTIKKYQIKNQLLEPEYAEGKVIGHKLGDISFDIEDIERNPEIFEQVNIEIIEWGGTKFGFDVKGFTSSEETKHAMKVVLSALNEDRKKH